MVLKILLEIIALAAQIATRAFARTLQKEYTGLNAGMKIHHADPKAYDKIDSGIGMTLHEAMNVLNIKTLDPREVQKAYDYLFKINDQQNGGTLYLQSKVYVAKQRLDVELKFKELKQKEKYK